MVDLKSRTAARRRDEGVRLSPARSKVSKPFARQGNGSSFAVKPDTHKPGDSSRPQDQLRMEGFTGFRGETQRVRIPHYRSSPDNTPPARFGPMAPCVLLGRSMLLFRRYPAAVA